MSPMTLTEALVIQLVIREVNRVLTDLIIESIEPENIISFTSYCPHPKEHDKIAIYV